MKRKNEQGGRATKSYSFTAPKRLARVLDAAAAKEGRTRSGLLVWLIRQEQEHERLKTLIDKACIR